MLRRAFTLIELMVVVAIIAIIAAILVPNFLKARQSSRQRHRPVAGAPAARPDAPPEQAIVPNIQRLEATMRLSNWSTRLGMDVTNRYRLSYRGQLQVALPGPGGPAQLLLPFPRQTEEAMNVHLRFRQGGRSWEPSDWTVTRWGLVAPLPLEAGESLEVDVEFEAQGRDQLVLELPPAHKLGRLKLQLTADQPGAELAEVSLQPQQRTACGWSWDLQNLVSQSPLVVELPASHSLMGKVLLLCRLAGLAVLLFGLGFWYAGELYRPGCLARFGWGHFFMLALTYSSFFPALCVLSLGQGMPVAQALAIAAALAQPLLLLHVWRSVDLRFSLFYVLPLADLTLALVVNGVFGEGWRELIFLGAGFVAVAFVTLTYPRWRANRQRWQSSQRRELQTRIQSLLDQADDVRELMNQGQNLSPLKPTLDMAQRQLNEIEALAVHLQNLDANQYSGVLAQVDSLELTQPYVRLKLSQGLQQSKTQATQPSPEQNYCLACGQPGHDSVFCGHCGVKKAVAILCGCGTKIWQTGDPTAKTHCPACGQGHESKG
jgi:prepilin-type N-terminal cleavage/methylation domain-containing protein